jgi:hypothetical protein
MCNVKSSVLKITPKDAKETRITRIDCDPASQVSN